MSEHDKEMVEEVKQHFELMKLADKLRLAKALKGVIKDPDKALTTLSAIAHEARVSGYNLGREEARKIR